MKSLNGAGRSRTSVSWVSAWRRSELTGPGPAGERSTAAGGRRFRVHVWLMLVPALTVKLVVSTTQTSVNNSLFVCHVRHCITRPMLHRNCLTYHHHHAFFSCTMLARSFYFYTTKHFCEIRMGSPLCPPPYGASNFAIFCQIGRPQRMVTQMFPPLKTTPLWKTISCEIYAATKVAMGAVRPPIGQIYYEWIGKCFHYAGLAGYACCVAQQILCRCICEKMLTVRSDLWIRSNQLTVNRNTRRSYNQTRFRRFRALTLTFDLDFLRSKWDNKRAAVGHIGLYVQ